MGIEAIGNEMPFVGIGGTTNLPKFADPYFGSFVGVTSLSVDGSAN